MVRLGLYELMLITAIICGSHGAPVDDHFSRLDIFQPNFHQTQRYRDTRSVEEPTIEVLMHLPPEFKDVNALRKFFGAKPERRRRDLRVKRDVDVPTSSNIESGQLLVDDCPHEHPYAAELQVRRYPDAVLEIAERPSYSEFSSQDVDADDPRKRRNTSANDHEDKRTYPDIQDATTAVPFWKQNKKSNSQFVTSREGRGQTSAYDMPQHRTPENARESHSMKEPTKSMSSNEIPRMQDTYYSGSTSSTRRTSSNSRQGEVTSPKSAYDMMDYSIGSRGQSRSIDSTGRLTESYAYNRPYTYPRSTYDRYYYPLPGEVGPRGVDYYHRTVDPGTGRIIYYASLPEPAAGYDPYYGRSFPARGYSYDAYGRPYPVFPSYPYPSYPLQDYTRNGRTIMEPYQQQRADFDRYRDDPRNKTYVIYDAEERRTISPRPYDDRYAPPPQPFPTYSNYPTQPSYYNYQPGNFQTSYRGAYYPEGRRLIGGESNMREVQIPLTTRTSTLNYDKSGTKSLKP